MLRADLPSEARLSFRPEREDSLHAIHADLRSRLTDLQTQLENCKRRVIENDRMLCIKASDAVFPFAMIGMSDSSVTIMTVIAFLLNKICTMTVAVDRGVANLNTELRLLSEINGVHSDLEQLIAEYPELENVAA